MAANIMKIKAIIRHVSEICILLSMLSCVQGCATFRGEETFRDSSMDFGSVRTVAVMPLVNLSREIQAADRVRDVFITSLLASGAVYVLPTGEVARNVGMTGMANPAAPNSDEVVKFCKLAKTDAVITGVLKEYGEIRSGSTVSDVVSMSLQMMEGQTGRVVWAASTTRGGISIKDRLLGGGGQPLNVHTEKAVHDLIDKLFE